MDLVFKCRRVVFELEGFEAKSFWKDKSLSQKIIHIVDQNNFWDKAFAAVVVDVDVVTIIDNLSL